MKDLRIDRLVLAGVLWIATQAAGSAGAAVLGIDVSRWQGDIDWPTVAASGKDFAFVKYTDSSDIQDPKAVRNVPRAIAAGLYVGVYHYATPFAYDRDSTQDFNNNDAVEEATWFVSRAGQYMGQGHLPPVLDIEWGEAAGRTRLTDWAKLFLDTVEGLTGVRPIIYANQYWATTFLTASELDTGLWMARWTEDPGVPPTILGGWSDYLFHQYSASTAVPGIAGNVDGNTFNGTLAELELLVNPLPPLGDGDYNANGQVEQGDLDLVLLNWGQNVLAGGVPAGWTHDAPSGLIAQAQLDRVLLNWGSSAEPLGQSVPEPGTLLLIGGLALLSRRAGVGFSRG